MTTVSLTRGDDEYELQGSYADDPETSSSEFDIQKVFLNGEEFKEKVFLNGEEFKGEFEPTEAEWTEILTKAHEAAYDFGDEF